MMPAGKPSAVSPGSPREQVMVYTVLVLYHLSPEESPAFRSLVDLLRSERIDAWSGSRICTLLLHDNSPAAHPPPAALQAGLNVRYQHDPSNPGLARPYQQALAEAQMEGVPWLLLLDQDTVLTADWLREMLAATEALVDDERVVAIVPRLLQDDMSLSPHPPMWHRAGPLDYAPGLKQPPLRVFNSGAVLRVAALSACGGFPPEFPLDYLDHAVFHALQRGGGCLFLLHAPLEHQLAGKHMDFAREFGRSPRLQSTAAAESRFYRRFGTPYEKLRHVLHRGRQVLRLLRAAKPADAIRLAWLTLAG